MKQVLTAEFSHETNTFLPTPTTLLNFQQHSYCDTASSIYDKHTNTRSSLAATINQSKRYNWNLRPVIGLSANPSGRVEDSVVNLVIDRLLQEIHKQDIDGVVLHLHGAMVSMSYEDVEGEILRRIRDAVGRYVPIIATLDLHGNITKKMVENSDALIAVRTYPHIDFYERAIQAGDLLQRCMLGEVRLYTSLCKLPIIGGCDGGRTQQGPMVELIRRGQTMEDDGTALVVSVCAGFTASDIYEIGPSVTVTVNLSTCKTEEDESCEKQRAQTLADSLGQYIWETREFCSLDIMSVSDAVALAQSTENDDQNGGSSGPLVLADVSDNPGSGHYGDTTALLSALLSAGLSRPVAFFAICDPEAVKQGEAIGIGGTGKIMMGGRKAPHLGGGPLEVTGVVNFLGESPEYSPDNPSPPCGPMAVHIAPTGRCMRFTVNSNVDICVTSNNGQAFDTAQLTSMGCDLSRCRTIALKSKHHFRAHFEPLSRQVVTVDGGGLGSVVLKGGGDLYEHVRRPIWPLDVLEEFCVSNK